MILYPEFQPKTRQPTQKMQNLLTQILQKSPDITAAHACNRLLYQEYACIDLACRDCPLSHRSVPRKHADPTRLSQIIPMMPSTPPTRDPSLVFDPVFGWQHARPSSGLWLTGTAIVLIVLLGWLL